MAVWNSRLKAQQIPLRRACSSERIEEGGSGLPASIVSWEGGSDGASLASAVRAHTGTRPCDPELLILVLLASPRIRRGRGARDSEIEGMCIYR